MADTNLYQELKDELQQVKDFLTTNVPIIKPAIQSLRQLIPQITDLLNKLIDLMGQIRTAISNLNVNNIPGLAQVSSFTQLITNVLNTVKNLLPNEADAINQVLGIAQVVGGLPSIDTVKQDILGLIDTIVGQLKDLAA
jgi:phage-related protein